MLPVKRRNWDNNRMQQKNTEMGQKILFKLFVDLVLYSDFYPTVFRTQTKLEKTQRRSSWQSTSVTSFTCRKAWRSIKENMRYYGFSSSHVCMWELDYKESECQRINTFELRCWEDSWESLGLQGDPTSPPWRKSILNIDWEDWCWGWNSNTLATWCKELTHWKRPWCWGRLKVGGEGDIRGWDGEWHHQLNGCEFLWTPGVGDGQGGLVCCSPWSCKESDMTGRLKWTEVNWGDIMIAWHELRPAGKGFLPWILLYTEEWTMRTQLR